MAPKAAHWAGHRLLRAFPHFRRKATFLTATWDEYSFTEIVGSTGPSQFPFHRLITQKKGKKERAVYKGKKERLEATVKECKEVNEQGLKRSTSQRINEIWLMPTSNAEVSGGRRKRFFEFSGHNIKRWKEKVRLSYGGGGECKAQRIWESLGKRSQKRKGRSLIHFMSQTWSGDKFFH